MAGVSGGVKAAATFGIGYAGGKMGAFDKMLLNPMLKGASTLSTSVTYNISKAMLSQVIPSVGRTLFTGLSMVTGEMLAKMLIFSSLGAGARWLIDLIFGT